MLQVTFTQEQHIVIRFDKVFWFKELEYSVTPIDAAIDTAKTIMIQRNFEIAEIFDADGDYEDEAPICTLTRVEE